MANRIELMAPQRSRRSLFDFDFARSELLAAAAAPRRLPPLSRLPPLLLLLPLPLPPLTSQPSLIKLLSGGELR